MSATPDSTLANSEQLIADLQRQLAECKAERDEALRQQTATAEVLQVINATPGDLTPVFDAMLERAMRLCEAAFGTLWTYDGKRFHSVAQCGVPAPYAQYLADHPIPEGGSGGVGARILRGERCLHVTDLREEEHYRTEDPHRRALVDLGGARTGLIVPLRKDASITGIFMIYRQEVQPFTDKQIALLENFSAQAVIAMENARLLGELRERTRDLEESLEYQTATSDVLQVISRSTFDLQPVLDTLCETAARLCGAASARIALRRDDSYRYVSSFATNSELDAMVREMRITAGRGTVTGRAVLERQTVHVADIAADPEYDVPEIVTVGGIRTILAVPLLREDEPIGVIALTRSEIDPFVERQIGLVRTFADQAVIAIENARLITETREALEQQTATAEVLQVINSSPGDLVPVFDAILEKAHALCGAEVGTLAAYDGEHFHALATFGYSEQFAEFVRRPFRPNVSMQRLIEGERVLHLPDQRTLESEPPDAETTHAFLDLTDLRTTLFVALRKDTSLLGYISAHRHGVRPFSEKEIALLQNFAAQAVIAMENARLLSETREALEQQTATAEVLGVINSSPGDLAPVFEAILDKGLDLCEAAFGTLWTFDGECFHAVALRRVPAGFAEVVTRAPYRPEPGSQHERLLRGAPHAQLDDAAAEANIGPVRRALVELGGARTIIAVPLLKDGAVVGAISAFRQEVRPFTDKQIALLQNFAAQAVIAMENARLLDELRGRTRDLQESLEYQTATSDVLNVISRSTADVQPVLDTVVETATRLCSADTAGIAIRDGEVYRPVANYGMESEDWAAVRQRTHVPGQGSIAGRVTLEGKVVHVADIRADPDLAVPEAVAAGGRTMLGVPLLREGAVLGTITLGRKRVEPYTERQIELVRTFADQAVIAIENARLLDELRQRTDEVAELNRGLEARVAEQVDELGRVGRLKRFLAPQLAELIVSQGDEKILESHRREIVVVFCDLRGYTAFTETAEPEEVLKFLREYHGALGPLVSQFEGTLDQFSGDGIMVFFNDPLPCPDPAERAVKMAMAMREEAGKLIAAWRRHGCELGFGAGIAQGYATLGQIGFSDRSGYTAIGTVCNLAARLCAEAKDGQILVSSHIAEAVEAVARLEDLGNLELKGLRRPVAAFNVVQSTSAPDARPNLTVVASGPGA